MVREDYFIAGMDCAEEVGAIEKELARLPGIETAAFDVLRSRMSVTFDADEVSGAAIREAVARAGLRADVWAPGHTERRADKGRGVAMAISGVLLVAAFVLNVAVFGWRRAVGLDDGHETAWWIAGLYTVSAVAGAWYVIPRAVGAARALRPDMNLLMTIAVVGALLIGEWFEAATVAFLFAFSLALERWSVGRARRAVEALMTLTPPEARVKEAAGAERLVPVEQVEKGQRIIVRPGDRIPLDGVVRQGTSWVNQAPVTGESLPVSRGEGAEVFAGSINGDGALEIEVTHVASESLLAQVARLIEEARLKRSGHERWVDRFARVYTPIVMALAVVILVGSPVLFGVPWGESFYNALVLLVIACPCALVISTPVSIVAALAASARHGVLIKSGVHVETPAKLRVLALDKTGTITRGALRVRNIRPMNGHTVEELLRIAYALEQRSAHPLARAICDHAEAAGISSLPAENLQNLPGEGARGDVDGRAYWIGSHRFLHKQGVETHDLHEELERLSGDGSTVVVVGNAEHVCGFFGLADDVHPEAGKAVEELRGLGVERIVMMTGDNEATARAIASKAGISEVHAELLPADKSRLVSELVAEANGAVAMVGDGVNDGPAMAAATVGIAMGGGGTDVAIETSDIVLMTDDLGRLPWLIRHGRRTVGIIRQNIFMALFFKALFTVLAALGVATLWMAIAADMGVSLAAVMNAMRILRERD